MRKYLILIFFLVLVSDVVLAKSWRNYKRGQVVEDKIFWDSKLTLKLPPGKWKILDAFSIGGGYFSSYGIGLVQEADNEIVGWFEISFVQLSEKAIVYPYVESIFKKEKNSDCKKRSRATLFKLKGRGWTMNCLIIRHWDMDLELYGLEDHLRHNGRALYRKHIRDNDLKIPPTL